LELEDVKELSIKRDFSITNEFHLRDNEYLEIKKIARRHVLFF